MVLQLRLSQIVAGLKSRNEETRERSSQELQHFVTTELREATTDQFPELMDSLVHCIFDLVNSTDVNEKKGGILAIGKNLYIYIFSVCYRIYRNY